MTKVLNNTRENSSAATGKLCLKTDVAASEWIAMATIAADFGQNSPYHASRRRKMLESTVLARLPSDKKRKWEIPDKDGPGGCKCDKRAAHNTV